MIESVGSGYDGKLEEEPYIYGDWLYGGITAIKTEDGYQLIDGHHRSSILIANGVKELNLVVFS